MPRVVITGVGAISTYGIGINTLWNSLIEGKTILKNIPELWRLNDTQNDFLYSPLEKLEYKKLGFSLMELMQYEESNLNMILSVKEALDNANFNCTKVKNRMNSYIINDINYDKLGLYLGTGVGGLHSLFDNYDELRNIQNSISGKLDTFTVAKTMPNNVAASVGIKFSMHKNINSYAYACATGTITIGKAYENIKNGLLDIAITGSSEYLNSKYGGTYNSFLKANTLLTKGNKESVNCPFEKSRSGFLFSDGAAGALVLESLEHAQKRGANIIVEITGFSESFDAYNMVSVDPSGKYQHLMIKDLLSQDNLSNTDIQYVNSHGTGTVKNDEVESKVLSEIFNDDLSINSTKSLLGHTIGASGSIEAIVTALSIQENKIHKNNFIENPISNQNFVNKTTSLEIKNAISQSFAFGGHNGALLFKKFEN
ncbi:MAG: beta-ketoacyl-[acyl-carrier-protein] synthase family protein [Campylobacteraceae bacterium]|nr:beta-ketoacyl-[acyl-carrier-protein] synthase family protein [Campylobacteraceae bacterium]